MLFLADLAIAILVAFAFTLILIPLLGWRRPAREGTWAGPALAFVLLFLFAWLGGLWIPPFGPVIYEISLLPFILTGLFVALIMLALIPPERPLPEGTPPEGQVEAAKTDRVVSGAFGAFFWLLMLLLVIAILAAYW